MDKPATTTDGPSRPEQFAWAAGLFEGEGSVIHRPGLRGTNRGLALGTTDLDVLTRFVAIVECGRIGAVPEKGVNRPVWRWQVTRWREVEPLVLRLLPYMGERRQAKLRLLLEDAPSRRSRGGWMPGESCARCGRSDRRHKARGFCPGCYTAYHRAAGARP